MAKHFANDEQRAAAYAAMKMLERLLKEDGELPPGFNLDISGRRVEVTFPPNTVVERDAGTNGDGTIYKKATQNLYGYALITALAQRLRCFNQWNVMRDTILQAVRDAIVGGNTLAQQLTAADPEFAAVLETIRSEMAITPRCEDTPRIVKDQGQTPTVTFRRPK